MDKIYKVYSLRALKQVQTSYWLSQDAMCREWFCYSKVCLEKIWTDFSNKSALYYSLTITEEVYTSAKWHRFSKKRGHGEVKNHGLKTMLKLIKIEKSDLNWENLFCSFCYKKEKESQTLHNDSHMHQSVATNL